MAAKRKLLCRLKLPQEVMPMEVNGVVAEEKSK